MYIDNKTYSLKNILLNKVDINFMNICNEYSTKFPSKWYYLIYSIITNQVITYFKDSTAIIQINKINLNNIEFFFKYIKILLNNKIVIKVIYKKEFIILHFNSAFHVDLIKNEIMIDTISLYKYLIKNNLNNLKIYYYCLFKYNKEEKIIPLVIKNQNKIYLFDNNPNYEININNLEIIYIFRTKKRGYQKYKYLQIYDNTSNTFDNLYKIIT